METCNFLSSPVDCYACDSVWELRRMYVREADDVEPRVFICPDCEGTFQGRVSDE